MSWSRNDWSHSDNPVKNGKQRIITLPDFVWEELHHYVNEVYPVLHQNSGSKKLFQLQGLPITSKTISYAYERARKVAGLERFDISGTHWVRKSGATVGRDASEDIYAVQQLLDHSSVKETQKYTAQKLSQVKKVTDAINAEFEFARKNSEEDLACGRGKLLSKSYWSGKIQCFKIVSCPATSRIAKVK